ncbi:Cytochrome c oxidase copper chaperone [Monascus purpureus]|uniref:Cytochrome c oxidase copper chaperone n=1 Tax=Monascus purpureus TaxID=5098 RepID=A0A507R0Q6_MONPU|nr:Cytochrome c oxidase copper chaperone [Monascus purpureus]
MAFNLSSLWGSSSAPSAPAVSAQSSQTEKPKPCCVCKAEKSSRDDCMLFSKSDDPAQDCKPMIEQYKACMAGYGFKI